jgi:hypothetical protein
MDIAVLRIRFPEGRAAPAQTQTYSAAFSYPARTFVTKFFLTTDRRFQDVEDRVDTLISVVCIQRPLGETILKPKHMLLLSCAGAIALFASTSSFAWVHVGVAVGVPVAPVVVAPAVIAVPPPPPPVVVAQPVVVGGPVIAVGWYGGRYWDGHRYWDRGGWYAAHPGWGGGWGPGWHPGWRRTGWHRW